MKYTDMQKIKIASRPLAIAVQEFRNDEYFTFINNIHTHKGIVHPKGYGR